MAKSSKWIGVYVLAAFVLLLSQCSQSSIDSAGALEAVNQFFKTFNSRNPVLWANSLHYPHIRKPGVGKPVRPSVPSLNAEDYANRFDYSRIIRRGWEHTRVESKRIVHITCDKAHIAARFDRSRLDTQFKEGRMTWKSLRVIQSGFDGVNVAAKLSRRDPSGQLLLSLSGLYLVTNLQGQWGVIGCSVIAR